MNRLINVLKAANQDVPEDLLKFGTTVKKKQHDVYGALQQRYQVGMNPINRQM
jgi:LysM repeat protein